MSLIDAQARLIIEQNLEDNLFVEAGAGSGKTTALAKRMLALIEHRELKTSQICAITFTNKAADHLKEKFQDLLEERLKETGHPLLKAAYESMGEMFIGTIHSLCQDLLSQMPLEAGLDPDFTLLDEQQELEFKEHFWAAYKNQLFEDNPAELAQLYSQGIGLEQLDLPFMELVSQGDLEFPIEQAHLPDTAFALKRLNAFVDDLGPFLPDEAPENDVFSRLCRNFIKSFYHFRGEMPNDVAADYLLSFASASPKDIVQKTWLEPKQAATIQKELLPELQENVLEPFSCDWQAYNYGPLMTLLKRALREYRKFQAERHLLGMDDLLRNACQMLKKSPVARKLMQERFSALLVDEFQDTDPLQSELVFYLCATDCQEQNWLQCEPKAGSLFIVGDPKQSIYRFRRADIALYELVKQRFACGIGKVLKLSSNFRSLSPLGEWINTVSAAQFFKEKQSEYQAPFMAMDCVQTSEEPAVFKMTSSERLIANRVLEEAERIASFIASEIASGKAVASDFMILSYKTGRLQVYAQALKQCGVSASLTQKAYGKGQLMLEDLQRLLDFLDTPQDELLGFAVLRSSLFGLSDQLLTDYRLCAQGQFSLEGLLEAGEDYAEIAKVALKLQSFKHMFSRLRPQQALLKIFDQTGLLALSSLLPFCEGGDEWLLSFLESLSLKPISSLKELREELQLFAKQAQVLSQNILKPMDQSVRIMNVHQAKGLEAKVVFLVDPGPLRSHGHWMHVARKEGRSEAYLSLWEMGKILARKAQSFVKKLPASHPHWPQFADKEACAQAAEHKRLLYVAATRAKERLVISCKEKSVWGDFAPFLEDCFEFDQNAKLVDFSSQEEPAKQLKKQNLHKPWQQTWQDLQSKARPVIVATSLKDKTHTPNWVASGYGMAFGRVMHRMLELLMANSDLDVASTLEALSKQESLEQKQVAEIAEILQKIQTHPLWLAAKASKQCLCEVPFAVPEKDKILSGSIDLVFEQNDAWVIVDYKTDYISGDPQTFVQYYAPQLEIYRTSWEKLTGKPVKQCGLFFTYLNQFFDVCKVLN